jgi:hypothetical protein
LNFIPTTATAAEKLKRLAKIQRKGTGSSLAVALDAVAQSNGYINWKHVTECLQSSRLAPKTRLPLPLTLQQFLLDHERSSPMSAETRQAFRTGLVFSMDVKEAESIQLSNDLVECDDTWLAAAADIWPVLVHGVDPESDKSLAESLGEEDLLDTATDDLGNFRHFRYTGSNTPATLEEAFTFVMKHSFFGPLFLWVKGQFSNMEDVSELRVDGQVVYAST